MGIALGKFEHEVAQLTDTQLLDYIAYYEIEKELKTNKFALLPKDEQKQAIRKEQQKKQAAFFDALGVKKKDARKRRNRKIRNVT